MKSEIDIDKYGLYEKLRKLAIISYEDKNYEMAQKILSVMVSKWPERVIARGKAISDVNISDSELNTSVTIP